MVIYTCWVNVLWASTHSPPHSVFYDDNFNISKRATFALTYFSYEWILLTGCRGKGSWIIWLQGFSPSWWSVDEETLQKGVPESQECARVPRWLEDSFSLICGAGSSTVRLVECSLKRYTKPVSKMRFSASSFLLDYVAALWSLGGYHRTLVWFLSLPCVLMEAYNDAMWLRWSFAWDGSHGLHLYTPITAQ